MKYTEIYDNFLQRNSLIADLDDGINLANSGAIVGSGVIDSGNLDGSVNTDIYNALANAATAQAIADGEIVGYYQDAEPSSGMAFGDIWIDTDGAGFPSTDNIYRYEDADGGSDGTLDWREAPTNAIGLVYLNAYDAQTTADGKIVTFYQDTEPTAGESSVGDLWIDTNDDNHLYRYNGSSWQDAQASQYSPTIDIRGWGQNIVYSATDNDTVAWANNGTITLANGTTYTISPGADTGNILDTTYIYLDVGIGGSETALQKTTTMGNAIGANKILLCVAKKVTDVTKKCEFYAFGGYGNSPMITDDGMIAADAITANTVGTNEIITNTANIANAIITDAKITGTITVGHTDADVTADNGQNVSWLNDAGDLATEDDIGASDCDTTIINGGKIITGLLTASNIQTGTLTVASGDIAEIVIKGEGFLTLKNASGTSKGELYADNTKMVLSTLASGLDTWIIAHDELCLTGNGHIEIVSGANIEIGNDLEPQSAGYDLGTSSYGWDYLYFEDNSTTSYFSFSDATSRIFTQGNFRVSGTLSKSAGSFLIDHPLKPETHDLQHSFVESPEMMNIYKGNAKIKNGKCIITMPDWFIPLNGKEKDDYSYFLTSLRQQNDLWVKTPMNDNGEVIFAGEKDGDFSYMITTVRHDEYAEANRIEVEVEKK